LEVESVPNNSEGSDVYQPIIDAVRLAAELCRRVQQTQVIRSEKPDDEGPVTIADYGSQAILCRAISVAYPNDAILAEEQSVQFLEGVAAPQRNQIVGLVGEILGESVSEADIIRWLDHGRGRIADRMWAVDPIDGTKGFLAGRRYTIAVGLLVNNQAVDSVMGAPGYPDPSGQGKLFYTDKSAAHMQSMAGGETQHIHVSARTAADPIIAAESVESKHTAHGVNSRAYEAGGLKSVLIERLDGQDKYCMIACGDADVYLRVSPNRDYRHKTWDHAAGIALIQAAGGVVSDLDCAPIVFSPDGTLGNQYIIVSNGLIHQNVLDGLRIALKDR
jgi:3'(2'), 5'-bisphosphate nucleotidase